MQKEIGSNFDLNLAALTKESAKVDLRKYGINGSDALLLSTGRSAIQLVLDEIEKRNPNLTKTALIPPFTCHTVIEPFLSRNYDVRTYALDECLNVAPDSFRNELMATDAKVVLVHRYYGFDTLKGIDTVIAEFRKKGVVFIEDKTQCLYSNLPDIHADYYVASMRKWAGLADGGFASCKEGSFHIPLQDYTKELMESKVKAMQWKYEYLHEDKGEKKRFLTEFRRAEDILGGQTGYHRICPISEQVQATMDVEMLSKKRKNNYRFVYERLCDKMRILSCAPSDDAVPLYIALSCEDRENLQAHLSKHDIYAPFIWDKEDCCPKVSTIVNEIYDTVICLPVDQRYDHDDMERMVEYVEDFLKCRQ